MKHLNYFALATLVPALGLTAQSVTILENQLFQPGNNDLGEAFGWSTKTDKDIPDDNKPTEPVEPTVDLDDPAVIDWMTAEHRGTAGVYDLKATDNFVLTFQGFSGSDNFESGHRFDEAQVFFGYTGGVNFNVPRDGGVAFGTSFNGADDGEAALHIRVDVDDRLLYVYHWWNFGYGDFENLNLSLHSADGTELDADGFEFNTQIAPSLGLDIAPGADYYSVNFTTIIEVQGTAEGDYLVMENIGTNVGWRGTAVATSRLDGGTSFEPGWMEHAQLGPVYAFTREVAYSPVMGFVHLYGNRWIYQFDHGYFQLPSAGDIMQGAFLYSMSYGWTYVDAANGSLFSYEPFGAGDVADFHELAG
jgi:hypothetical protein